MTREIPKIAGAIALPLVGGLANAYLTLPELLRGHQRLNFLPVVPPKWMFPPVWTGVNAAMGYASYLVWKDGGGITGTAKLPLMLYGTQLALNWTWSPIFFKLRCFKWSFLESLVRAGAVAATGLAFFNVNKLAGYLVVPYFVWCTCTSLLNFEFYIRNPGEGATVEEESS
ncbi:translocator protein-like [Culex pipiens pallens]|uniref:translocator protein-like n=1 Tax=Culex pipiens pallens TaxID=42434 RepID=UPI001954FFA7|nr:translocator protein-like [Culex pipiens pallens]